MDLVKCLTTETNHSAVAIDGINSKADINSTQNSLLGHGLAKNKKANHVFTQHLPDRHLVRLQAARQDKQSEHRFTKAPKPKFAKCVIYASLINHRKQQTLFNMVSLDTAIQHRPHAALI